MSRPAEISLGYSPCPNDTFIFSALAEGRVATGGIRVRRVIEDVEALNQRALRGAIDVTKVSFHAFARLRDQYALLDSGAALGRGCGPLVVAREPMDPRALRDPGGGPRIAVPGPLTTATLLLRLFAPQARRLVSYPFERIFDAVLSGQTELGVIIHEGRFTYGARGLVKVLDLGEWWEAETGLPLPLGGIVASRSLGADFIREVEGWVRSSVLSAREDPGAARDHVRAHAQEMEEAVVQAHIALYVNDFTVSLGEEGQRAVTALLTLAEERGVVPRLPESGEVQSKG